MVTINKADFLDIYNDVLAGDNELQEPLTLINGAKAEIIKAVLNLNDLNKLVEIMDIANAAITDQG